MDAGELESWLRIGATVGIGGSGVWLIWFLAKKLWSIVWEGTREQLVQAKEDLKEERRLRAIAEQHSNQWEDWYRELYWEYVKYVPVERRIEGHRNIPPPPPPRTGTEEVMPGEHAGR